MSLPRAPRRRRRGRGDPGRRRAGSRPARRRRRRRLTTARHRPVGASRPAGSPSAVRRHAMYTSRHVLCGAWSRPDASLRFDHGAGAHRRTPHRGRPQPPSLPRRTASRRPTGKRSSGKVRRVSQQCTAGPRAARARDRATRRRRRHRRDRASRRPRRRRAPASPTPPPHRPRRSRLLAGRRLPHPPGRRAPLWFAALVAGALLAAAPERDRQPAGTVTATASDYGLGAAADVASAAASTTPASAAASPRPRPRPASASWPPPAPRARRRPSCPRRAGSPPASACAGARCTTASTWPPRWARRSTPPPTASCSRPAASSGLRQRRLHPGRRRQRPHLRPHALLRRRGRRHRARRRPDREGRQRGLLDRPAPALRDPPRRHGRPADSTPRTGSPSAASTSEMPLARSPNW